MRVGLFTESYDPVINGVSTSVKTLAAELAAAGHAPVVVAPRFPGFTDEGQNSGSAADVLRLPSIRTRLNPDNPFVVPPLLGWAPSLLRPASDLRTAFDLVHTQQPFGLGMHGRRYARRRGVPLVSTYHTLYDEYAHYFPFLPRPLTRVLMARHLRRYYNGCDAVIVPSKAAGRVLRRLGVTDALVRVVPTGVPPPPAVMPNAVRQARRAFDLPDGTPVLLFVGRLAREKNLDLLLRSFARLQTEEARLGGSAAPALLLLAGSGPHLPTCRRLAGELGIEACVRFTGFLSRTQLAPVYAVATLFVFPSATDTQGVVLSEAQSHGLPCVVVNGGGAPEFVRDGVDALVVPPGDVAAFHAAVAALLADPARRRAMAVAALESHLRPTPAGMAWQIISVYEAALAGCGRGGVSSSAAAVRHTAEP